MNAKKWGNWGAMIAMACIVAGCGGEGGPQAAAAAAVTAGESGLNTMSVSHGAAAQPAGEFDGKDMAGFTANADNGFFNTAVKLMIATQGPQRLIDHLQAIQQSAEGTATALAADKFIALIHAAYNSETVIDAELQAFLESVWNLSPRLGQIAASASAPELKNATLGVVDLIDDLYQVFDLASMPGVTFAPDSDAPADAETLEPFVQHFHAIRPAATTEIHVPLSLQMALDLLNQPGGQPAQAPDVPLIETDDVEQVKQLTIAPPVDDKHWLEYNTANRATLKVFDRKTQKTMLVTLAPKALLMEKETRYCVLINDTGNEWNRHDGATVSPMLPADIHQTLVLMAFEVVSAVPAQ